MELTEQKIAYERYLTERLDSEQSQNIVISTTADLIRLKVKELGKAKVLDMGCFSGAMLNRVRNELSAEIRGVTEFVGADIDEETLEIGRKKYQGLDLKKADLTGFINHLGTFDIIVLANIIHETLTENPNPNAEDVEAEVKQTLRKVSGILPVDGSLVILDGLKPTDEESWLTINFKSLDVESLFVEFSQKYKAFPVLTNRDNELFKTRKKDLAAFLTKARYLHENYWAIESVQNYQYYSSDQFTKTLQECGMTIKRIEPQGFPEEYLGNLFKSTDPIIDFPAKNILIVANKN